MHKTRESYKAGVRRAMRRVPRHKFIPLNYAAYADADAPLPIGYGLRPGDKVLEIGTGSGYQTAILAELGYVEVYSVEIIPELAEQAAARLQALGYTNTHLRQADGHAGWEEHAPYNAIIVTAAPDHLPPPLANQLADGGRLVIPIGPPGEGQTLWKFVKQGNALQADEIGSVAFVPFTRKPPGQNTLTV
ncbi:MAG: Protein-L-isoaspartate O-methyltransferase [Anaerolineales bacterium]|nr:Protein-L-isoaspartate O-methyltransferase [Anaerolineales bacterium]